MLSKLLLLFLLSWWIAPAQDKPPEKSEIPASVAGRVTVAGTGKPMPGVEVYANRNSPDAKPAVTDSNGRYALKGLPPGTYRISANAPDSNGRVGFGPSSARQVKLEQGQELENFDFQLVLPGEISGKVVDQYKEPVPDARVFLVVREYVSGGLRAVFAGAASTDDRGEYHLTRVQPGRAYEILAVRWPRSLPAISDAPADPKFRRPAVIPTYYPTSRTPEGAQAVVLKPGEQREGLDIRLVKTPSYCLEGVVEAVGGPSTGLRFEIAEAQPTSGSSGSGGFYMSVPRGTPEADGKIRVCDLHPGDYELSTHEYNLQGRGDLAAFGSVLVTITDRDVENVRVTARPHVPFAGEVVWDGPAPETPLDAKLTIDLQALSRTERGSVSAAIPGPFSLENGLLMDNFAVSFRGVPKDVYVKDITYGGHSILHSSLKLGTAMGDGSVRISLARDGGIANARVTDKDGNPVPDCSLVLMPASAGNEAALSAAMVTGRTDLRGTWSSASLAPGKYYVIATLDSVNKSPESIARLWLSRTGAQEVDISPNSTAAVTLTPKSIE